MLLTSIQPDAFYEVKSIKWDDRGVSIAKLIKIIPEMYIRS
ncbi:Uncharacterised protein [Salmonella enterica subsp. arizonae]|uniref:Uncharacterized protein n=1 Tax=Salmonella enterica subsp. arizonae TaxID=59203 RepID=A0A379RZ42_SALER|nr:Uncharacterised protein [Salmonella enterica subsp. arizonae]